LLDQTTQMKKLTMTGHAGVVAAAILASVGLAPTAKAQLTLAYQDTISGHTIGEAFTGGSYEIQFFNFDMGTVYSATPGTSVGYSGNPGAGVTGGVTTLNGLPQQPATGAWPTVVNGEDSWGIAQVAVIYDTGGSKIWTSAGSGQDLTIMFYGAQDFQLTQQGATQEISSVGLHVDMYLQTIGGVGYTQYNPSLGSSGRTALDQYTSVTDGIKILSTVSTPGFLYANGDHGGLATEFTSTFALGTGGLGSTYLNVTGGTMAANFDTNSVTSLVGGSSTADMFARFTTTPYDPNSLPGTKDDWLVRSHDPVSGAFVAVPEPSTYGLIAAGALLGLVAIRRMKVRSQAV